MTLPRPEYPRPQFVRNDWICLNGEWQFEIDQGDSGLKRGLKDSELSQKIVVPFCPESELSGIGHTDFIHAVWYRREIEIPGEWAGRNVHLHFQAVDYDSTVWVNGTEVGCFDSSRPRRPIPIRCRRDSAAAALQ
jgi:beta-galactosidase/beta-glucuronidase